MAARRLGAAVALVGVVGQDAEGEALLQQALGDGLEVAGVTRRPTGLAGHAHPGDG